MSLRLGDIAPDFKAKTSMGDISFHEYLEIVGEFYFLILPILNPFAPLN